MKNKQYLLMIMDGVGLNDEERGNAFKLANTPNLDRLTIKYPNTYIRTSGMAVGLPEGQMGNSEVGHTNIGAGRIVYQELTRITKEIQDGDFYKNEELKKAMEHVKNNNSTLHLLGLVSDGGVHSHIEHLFALLEMAKREGISNVYVHAVLDGRDTPPTSAVDYIKKLEEKMKELGVGKIATISGRYYAMDRDNRWDRIEKTYKVMTEEGNIYNIENKIKEEYQENITDEFIKPFKTNKITIKENDGILVFNFRPDRLRELFTALTNPSFNEFERKYIKNLKLVTMMPVDKDVIYTSLFNHPKITNYLGEVLAKNNLKQLRIAETEKYAHVTYFFDGENKTKLKNCDQILIPSPKVKTYDLKPEMSAYEITDTLIDKLKDYDVVILNFANGDMVGHTGNFEATVKAIEAIDNCIGKIYKKIKELNGTLIITADHGNCDYMQDDNKDIITSHSISPVPFLITDKNIQLTNGKLADIAPTILTLLNIKLPKEMTGKILIMK